MRQRSAGQARLLHNEPVGIKAVGAALPVREAGTFVLWTDPVDP